jgi:hypothetical protein
VSFSLSHNRQSSLRHADDLSRCIDTVALPFFADYGQAESAHFELVAQPAQHGQLFAVQVVVALAGEKAGSLALPVVIDKEVDPWRGPYPVERFGAKASPRQRDVAYVAVDFPRRAAVRNFSNFGDQISHLIQQAPQPCNMPELIRLNLES